MTRFLTAAACAACLAGPAMAGDQPVIFPTMPPVYEDGTPIHYFYKFDTVKSTGVVVNLSGATGSAATGAAAPAAQAGGVLRGSAAPLARSNDALYSALLKEAQARGLR